MTQTKRYPGSNFGNLSSLPSIPKFFLFYPFLFTEFFDHLINRSFSSSDLQLPLQSLIRLFQDVSHKIFSPEDPCIVFNPFLFSPQRQHLGPSSQASNQSSSNPGALFFEQ